MKYSYKPEGICPTEITFEIEGNVIHNISFVKGCDGNLKVLSRFAEGLTIEQIEEKCKGILCGKRATSCADQFAIAVRKAYNDITNDIANDITNDKAV